MADTREILLSRDQANETFEGIIKGLDSVSEAGSFNERSINDKKTDIMRRHAQHGIQREAWIMSTVEWLVDSTPPKGIAWFANPSDISWQPTQRGTHTKNMIGTALHVWPDSGRQTFYDEFRITMNLQSGNLLPVFAPSTGDGGFVQSLKQAFGSRRSPTPNDFQLPGGIVNFFDFKQLVDAPKLTEDGRANNVIIQYYSNLFPQLTLVGMFDPSSPYSFSDSSMSPNKVNNWTANFIVYDTVPRLSDNSGLSQTNSQLLNLWFENNIKGKKVKPSTPEKITEVTDLTDIQGIA